MAQTNYTPIQLYYSSTASAVPVNTNLASGELAINITDGLLFYKDNAGTVQKIGYKLTPTTAGGTGLTSFTANGIVYASSTSALATNSALTFDGSTFAVTGATTVTSSGNSTVTTGIFANTSTGTSAINRFRLNGGTSSAFFEMQGSGFSGTNITNGPTTSALAIWTGSNIPVSIGVNASEIGRFSSTGLAITPGVLTLGQDTVYDAFINTPESMYFNVDSDGNSTGNSFIWGTDRAGTTGGTEFMRISGATGGVGAVGIGYSSLTSVGNNGLAVLGNVGIGTSSPSQPLHVSKNQNASTWAYVSNTTAGTGSAAGFLFASDVVTGAIQAVSSLNTGLGNNNSLWIRTTGAYPITLGTNSTVQMTLDSSGNLGIGTSSPGYKLDVLGNVNRFAGASVDGIFLSTVAATDTSYYGANYYNNNGTEGVNASGRASWRIATVTAGSPTFSIGYRAASAGAGVFSTPLTIDSSGNLGIGGASTGSKLYITATNPTATFKATTTGYPYASFVNDGGDFYVGRDNSAGGAFGYAYSNVVWGTGAYSTLFATNNQLRMTLDANGNLGLGTSSPSTYVGANGQLVVYGAVGTTFTNNPTNVVLVNNGAIAAGLGCGINFAMNYNGSIVTTYGAISCIRENATSGNEAGALVFGTRTFGGGVNMEKMRLDSSGNLLVGKTSGLGGKLELADASTVTLNFTNTATSATNSILGYYNSTYGALVVGDMAVYAPGGRNVVLMADNASGIIKFASGGNTERARIDSSGNVGIAQTDPTNNGLSGYNNLVIGNSSSSTCGLTFKTTSSGTPYPGIAWSRGAGAGANGKVYYDQSTDRLYCQAAASNGVYLAGGGTSWTSASDERVKDIIEPIENATQKLANWRTVIGKYKSDTDGVRRSFLIAQDVLTTFPEAVNTDKAEEYGLNYQDLIPLLVASIQELKAEFDAYKASHP